MKIGDVIRISKQKNTLAKSYIPNWYEEIFVITKVKNIVPWTYAISDLNGEEIVRTFSKTNCKKQIRKSLGFKK